MKSIILSNWTLVRWLQLVLFVFVTYEAIASADYTLLLLSAFVLYQMFFSPCGRGTCAIPQPKNPK